MFAPFPVLVEAALGNGILGILFEVSEVKVIDVATLRVVADVHHYFQGAELTAYVLFIDHSVDEPVLTIDPGFAVPALVAPPLELYASAVVGGSKSCSNSLYAGI